MTQPVSHGFPDWNRTVAASDIEVISQVGINIPGSQDFGPFFVGNMPYLFVECVPANRARVTLSWFADSAQTKPLNDDVLISPVGAGITQCVPIRGPYLLVSVEVSVNPTNTTLRVFMTPEPFAASAGLQGLNTLISVNGTNVGAGATVNFDTVETRGGWAYWHAHFETAVAFRIKLYSVSFTGALTLIDFVPASVNQEGKLLMIPATQMRIEAFNADGVARTLFAVLLHHPFYP